ncbi:MAG: SDR family oxidoreductase [Solirubrobacterales bacterium]|nr:SDR family oxidoreductase [Solirubrobacterales bacterium]MBV9943613.1 SDR family oxidoreductase [Solirubrobacterales bacterium]
MANKWTAADIPDQTGRLVVITGANSGLGLATARELARAGAYVVLAVRSTAKGDEAAGRIRSAVPGAALEVAPLDLADLGSVRGFAGRLAGVHDRLDLLINNAGVMAAPRRLTKDGFESQFGTNHLGHFALTGLLLQALLKAPAPRVVTVSSTMHRGGKLNFDDLQGERQYSRWGAYSQSKLANLMFCFELQRRAAEAQTALLSLAAHPGYADTNLQFAGPDRFYEKAYMWIGNKLFAQSADMGALPTLYGATFPGLPGGTYVGPGGPGEQRGHPKVVTAAGKAYDEQAWRRLWNVSEQLSGVRYEFPKAAAAA